MTTVLQFQPPRHSRCDDPVARAFAVLSGRTQQGARTWLRSGHNLEVTLALQAFRETEAWARRESWAAPLRSELDQIPLRALDDDLILAHHELDQQDDGWRLAYVNYKTTDSRRQWCRALSRFHAMNLQMMVALKQETA